MSDLHDRKWQFKVGGYLQGEVAIKGKLDCPYNSLKDQLEKFKADQRKKKQKKPFNSPMTNTTLTFNSPFPSVLAMVSSIRGTNSSATIGCSKTSDPGSSSSCCCFFFFLRRSLIGFPSTIRDKSSTASASSSYSESLSPFLTVTFEQRRKRCYQ